MRKGRKVVRVNDVTFLKEMENGSQVLHILEIDIGIRSIVRRVLSGIVPAGYSFAAAAHSSAFDSLGILQYCGGRSTKARKAEYFEQAARGYAPSRFGRYR